MHRIILYDGKMRKRAREIAMEIRSAWFLNRGGDPRDVIAQALAAERAMALEEAARDAETLEGGLTSASRLRALVEGK